MKKQVLFTLILLPISFAETQAHSQPGSFDFFLPRIGSIIEDDTRELTEQQKHNLAKALAFKSQLYSAFRNQSEAGIVRGYYNAIQNYLRNHTIAMNHQKILDIATTLENNFRSWFIPRNHVIQ